MVRAQVTILEHHDTELCFFLFDTDARGTDHFKIHSRHNWGDGKELSHQVGQVAVHKYEERLDFSDPGGEPCGKGGRETKKYAEAHPAQTDHEKPGHS